VLNGDLLHGALGDAGGEQDRVGYVWLGLHLKTTSVRQAALPGQSQISK